MSQQFHSWHIPGENHNFKRYMHPNAYCSTIYSSQDMDTTSMPINRGMDQDVVHAYSGIFLSHRKEWNCAICRERDGPRDKSRKSEREKQVSSINAYMWNLEKWYICIYLQSRDRDTDTENRRMDPTGGGRVGWTGRVGVKHTQYHVWGRWLMRTYCAAQGTLLNALCWPKQEGNPKRGHVCTADSKMYNRN